MLGVLNQFSPQHRFCNLGYWVRASAQGKGVASQAAKLLAGYAFEELRFTH